MDEADPKVQEKKIDTALEYGVNTFIFDWYWYDDKPFLGVCLGQQVLMDSSEESPDVDGLKLFEGHACYLPEGLRSE